MNDIFEKKIEFGLEINNKKYYGRLKITYKSLRIILYNKHDNFVIINCFGTNVNYNNDRIFYKYINPRIVIDYKKKHYQKIFYIDYNEKDNIKIQINKDNIIELPINKKLHLEVNDLVQEYSEDYDVDAYLKEYVIVDNNNEHLISNLIIDLNYEIDNNKETKRIIITDNAREFLFVLNQFFIEWNQYKGALDNTTKYYINKGSDLNE